MRKCNLYSDIGQVSIEAIKKRGGDFNTGFNLWGYPWTVP